MIFVTVGEQLPFDRLIKLIDQWNTSSRQDVFAQIGRSKLKPSHIAYQDFLSPEDFADKFQTAELIIAHAGMGTIITALEMGKPLLVMPRQASKGEHRNDHQFATAKRFTNRGISVALDDAELIHHLTCLEVTKVLSKNNAYASRSSNLINTIRGFVFDD